MLNLKSNEIQEYNNILLNIYNIDDIKTFEECFLVDIRAMVPYNQAVFSMIYREHEKYMVGDSAFIDISENMKPLFYDINSDKDYIRNFFAHNHSIVYIDSAFEGNISENNDFYKIFRKSQGLNYSCGIVLIKDRQCIGIVTLYRSEDYGDFTEKEIFILELFKTHITNIMADRVMGKSDDDIDNDMHVTPREREIIDLLIKGATNEEIAKELYISVSTTKKHVYNIFKKYGVKNRIALIKSLEKK